MHRQIRLMGLFLGLWAALFFAAPAFARPQGDSAGEAARDIWGVREPDSPGPPSRHERAPVTVSGVIVGLSHVTPKGYKTRIQSLTLATDQGVRHVVLAPAAALREVADRLTKGQVLTVTGLPHGRKIKRRLLAQTLAFAHGPSLILRDQDGRPVWTRGPRR